MKNSRVVKQAKATGLVLSGDADRSRTNHPLSKQTGRSRNWADLKRLEPVEEAVVVVSEQVSLPFGICESLGKYLKETYPGVSFAGKGGASYSHPKSFIDRLMAFRYIVNEAPASLFGLGEMSVVVNFLGNKFVPKSFETTTVVLSCGGVKSQFDTVEQARLASYKQSIDYAFSFDFYDFEPCASSWSQMLRLMNATSQESILAAFVPTHVAVNGSSTHELNGRHVSPDKVKVSVVHDSYVDTDNGWLLKPGSVQVGDQHIHWETLGVKFGIFRIAHFTIRHEPARVIARVPVDISQILSWSSDHSISGGVIGVPSHLAEFVEIKSGVMHFHRTQLGGYVPLKVSLVHKLITHAIKIPDLTQESSRMVLERIATGLSDNPVEAAMAAAVARVSAAKVSLQSSLIQNTEEAREVMAKSAMARKRVLNVSIPEGPADYTLYYKVLLTLLVAVIACVWGGDLRYSIFSAILPLSFSNQLSGVWKALAICFSVACLIVFINFPSRISEPVTFELPSRVRDAQFFVHTTPLGDKVLASHVSKKFSNEQVFPTVPEAPESNLVHNAAVDPALVWPTNLVSKPSKLCVHFGIECEAPINDKLLDSATVVQVGETKFPRDTAPVSAFVGISVAATPHVIATTTHNEEVVLKNRAFAHKGNVDDAEMIKFSEWVEAHFLEIFNLTEEFAVVEDVGAWFAGLQPAKAKLYAKYDKHSQPTIPKKNYVRDAFLKTEHVMKNHYEKPGRLVQGADPSMNLTLGPWVSQFSKLLHILWHDRYRVFFNGSVNAEQEGSRYDFYTSLGYIWADGDFSSFDSTQTRGLFEVLHRIYERFGAPPVVLAVLKNQIHKVGYTRGGMRYEADATRASGDPDTLVGNGIINYTVNLYAWHKQHPEQDLSNAHAFTPSELSELMFLYTNRTDHGDDVYCDPTDQGAYERVITEVRGTLTPNSVEHLHDLFEICHKHVEYSLFPIQVEVCGDDNLTAYNPRLGVNETPAIIALLGMVNNVNHQTYPEICSSLFWPTLIDGKVVSVLSAKPGRLAVKIGYISKPVGKHLLSELCSKIYGTLKDVHHVPFLSQLLKKYLELIPNGIESKPLYHKYKAHAEQYHPVTEEGIAMFCDRYHFTRAEYEELVGSLELITELPWTHRHVLFDRLYEKDNDYLF